MSHLIRYEYRAIKDTRRIQKQHFKEQHQVRTCPIMLDLFQPLRLVFKNKYRDLIAKISGGLERFYFDVEMGRLLSYAMLMIRFN